jgi:hypothetical protein
MNDQSERILAALLRFKAMRSAAGDARAKPTEAEQTAPARRVVVDERNLAALLLSSVGPPEGPPRKLAATNGR